MRNFKLVILDYPKLHLDNPDTQRILNDVIVNKQKNFERTDPNFIVMDKHDMIGTHYLIYDVSNFCTPKLVLALRTTFEDRAKFHRLTTPIQDLVPHFHRDAQEAYKNFKAMHPVLADCNSWFVDPFYTQKNSGLKLSDIGYGMVYAHVTRCGFDHIIGCTNEKYRASRWLENVGYFEKNYDFVHPVVPDIHKFIMVEQFKTDYLSSIYYENKYLFDSLMEVLPPTHVGADWEKAKSVFTNPSAVPSILSAA